MRLRAGSLFSGVGGLELGLEWALNSETIWQVEEDFYAREVLAKHWPHAKRFEDVRRVGRANLALVDIICGGFPCQDLSSAGLGAGLDGHRSGLWREFRRVVDELRPAFVVVENVTSGKRKWLPTVRRDLHVLGYRTRALGIAARDVGAPHRRARIFVVAYSDGVALRKCAERLTTRPQDGVRDQGGPVPEHDGSTRGMAHAARARLEGEGERRRLAHGGGDVAHADGEGQLQPSGAVLESGGWPLDGGQALADPARVAERATADQAEPIADRGDTWCKLGGGGWWFSEPDVGRVVDGFPDKLAENRWADELRVLGNAAVPQCAYVAGLVVRQMIENAA